MAPVLSYIVFSPSENFVKEREQYRNALEEISAVDGVFSSYHGLQVEEEGAKQGYLVSLWNSPEQLKAFRDSAGEKFEGILAALVAGEVKRHEFIPAQRLAAPALDAKTTEFVIIQPKAGASKDAVREAAIKVSDGLEAVGHSSAIGESIDGSGVFLLVGGWETAAEHWDVIKIDPLPTIIGELEAVADLDITHVSLKKRSA